MEGHAVAELDQQPHVTMLVAQTLRGRRSLRRMAALSEHLVHCTVGRRFGVEAAQPLGHVDRPFDDEASSLRVQDELVAGGESELPPDCRWHDEPTSYTEDDRGTHGRSMALGTPPQRRRRRECGASTESGCHPWRVQPEIRRDGGRPDEALAWAQLLLTILEEGRRTATYKLAVLLALLDCCVLGTDAQGRAPRSIPVRDLAGRVLELYWRQVRP